MAEPPAAAGKDAAKDKKEAKRLEEEAKKEAKAREEAAKREAKAKEKEAKEREKEKEREAKRLEKEAKEQEAREKEQKRKEAKQKEEEAKREAKLKKEEAEREKKLKEKMEKEAKAKKGGKSPREEKIRRHSKYRLSGGSMSGASGATKVIGSPLALVMHAKPDGSIELPQLFVAGINFLQDHLNTEGLFRISGSMQEINAWRAELDSGREITFAGNMNPHSVAGILKLFLRELPEPLLTFPLYDDWCMVAETPVANKQQRLQMIAELLPRMPKANVLLLTELIRLLSAVAVFSAVNKMTSANLGLVFGPNVMRGPDEGSMNLMYTCDVISFMIDNSAAFISIAGGGAAIVETGEVAEAAETPEPEEDTQDASVDGSHVGSHRSEASTAAGAAVGGAAAPAADVAPLPPQDALPPPDLLPPPMDAPPPPPPPEEL